MATDRQVGTEHLREGITEAEIVEHTAISAGVFRLRLSSPDVAATCKPGQFLNLYLNGGAMLLPRPISIADVEDGCVTLVYAAVGRGTELLSKYARGACVRVLGPNGNGYDMDMLGRHVILIGGGLGVPPLLFAAGRIREMRDVKITAVLGYRDEQYCLNELRERCDAVHAISEKDGNVMDLIASLVSRGMLDLSNATVLTCGPKPMLQAVTAWARTRGLSSQVSLEERMGCGYGACVGCTCEVVGARQKKKVCVDGPVCRGEESVGDTGV
jgi:dihydroorotate dehydrogenase electron transfer subunit